MGIEELLEHTKIKKTGGLRDTVVDVLEKKINKFFWSLNTNSHYEASQYGGVIEQGFHPSGIAGMGCPRMEILKYHNVTPDEGAGDINPDLRRIFDNGHSVHDRWQRYFSIMSGKEVKFTGQWKCKGCSYLTSDKKEMEKPSKPCPKCGSERWKYNEFRLRDKELNITGKRDGKLVIDGTSYLLEIKSINTFGFANLNGVMPSHLVQINLYMFLDKTYKAIVLYEDKNNQKFRLFEIDYDESIIKDHLTFIKMLNVFLKKKTLPPILEGYPKNKECKACGYLKQCQSIDVKKIIKK